MQNYQSEYKLDEMRSSCHISLSKIRNIIDEFLQDHQSEEFSEIEYYENSLHFLTLRAKNVRLGKDIALKVIIKEDCFECNKHNEAEYEQYSEGSYMNKYIISQKEINNKYIIYQIEFNPYKYEQQIVNLNQINTENYFFINNIKDKLKNKNYSFQGIGFCKSIRYLDLDCTNIELSDKQATGLAKIIQNNTSLQKLKLEIAQLGLSQQGIIEIGNSLTFSVNLQYLKLGLKSNYVGNQGGQVIANSIRKFNKLKEIDLVLSWCDIDEQSTVTLGQSLSECKALEIIKIDLSQCNITQFGAIQLGIAIGKCQNLTNLYLNLFWCKIGDEGCISIAKGINNCENLKYLNLNLKQSELKDKGVGYLISIIGDCNQLRSFTLVLYANQCSYSHGYEIQEIIKFLQEITYLELDMNIEDFKNSSFKQQIKRKNHKLVKFCIK